MPGFTTVMYGRSTAAPQLGTISNVRTICFYFSLVRSSITLF
jgi:hypothetical protein